jgi:hypothetical protein
VSDQAMPIVALSQETTCYVSAKYLSGRGKFDDFSVREAGHIYHNWRRDYAGLPHSRRKERLLEIEYRKRETFAYACEVYAPVLEQARSPRERLMLIGEYAQRRMRNDERVNPDELVGILRETAAARSGWKWILVRCAPRARRGR